MNKFAFWLKSFFLRANLPKADFDRIKSAVAASNRKTLIVLSLASTIIFGIVATVAFTLDNPFLNEKRIGYVIAVGSSLLAFILGKTIVSKDYKNLWLPMLLMEGGIMCYALYTTLIASPQQMSISLIVMLVLIPLLFIKRPYQTWILYILVDLIFIFYAPKTKPAESLTGEIVNVISFTVTGLVVSVFFAKNKLERLLFEDKVNQMDDKELLNKNLRSVTDIYVSMHQIDLTTGYFFGLRSNDFIDRNLQNNHEDANTQFKYIMCALVSRDFLTDTLDFVNLKTLPDRMKGKRVITKEFLGNNLGWCRCQFVAQGKVTPNSMPTSVIFTVQEINDEVKART